MTAPPSARFAVARIGDGLAAALISGAPTGGAASGSTDGNGLVIRFDAEGRELGRAALPDRNLQQVAFAGGRVLARSTSQL